MRRRAGAIVIAALTLCVLCAAGGPPADAEQGGMQGGGVLSLGDTLVPTSISAGLTALDQETASIIGPAAKVTGAVNNLLDSMHTFLLMMGARLDVEIQYEPMDAPQAIHLRQSPLERRGDRRIRIDVTVSYQDDVEGRIPLPSVRRWLGSGLPKKGDRLAGVAVRFRFPKSLTCYLEVPLECFDTAIPAWIKRTNENGMATIFLYPKLDQPLGGIREIAEGSIEIDVPMGLSKGFSLNPFDMAIVRPLGDEIRRAVSAWRTVQIERHKPTNWVGSITLQREITAAWSAERPGPSRLHEGWFVSDKGRSKWTEEVTVNGIRLNDEGLGSGSFAYMVEANIAGDSVHESIVECKSGPRKLTGTCEYNGAMSDANQGSANIELRVDHRGAGPEYTVVLGTRAVQLSPWGFGLSMGGAIKHTSESCDGTSKWTDKFDINDSSVSSAATIPATKLVSSYDHFRSMWKPFDPDAPTLQGSDSWYDDPVTSPDGSVTYTVRNTLTWSLRRVID